MHQDNPARVDPTSAQRSVPAGAGDQHLSAELHVQWIAAGESLGDVQRLRRDVYFHEQGGPYSDRSKRIADGLDACGATLAINQGASAIATLRLHDFGPSAVQVEYGSLFQIDPFAHSWPLDRVAVGTRFAVQADHRVKPVMDRLMEDTYRRLLPGREIVTVDATSLARTGGALRCVTLNIPYLGHPMAFEGGSAAALIAGTPSSAGPSRIGAFVTSEGWYGPRRSVLQMEV